MNNRERDLFIARCGLSVDTARALLRHATTLQRLAEAQCNGDWPADNGQRKVEPCPLCEGLWAPSSIQGGTAARAAWRQLPDERRTKPDGGPTDHGGKACPDCRTEARVRLLLEGTQWQAWTQGDPRGYVLKLFPRTVEGCECGAKANRPGGTVYHNKTTCRPGFTHRQMPVTHDDMHCGRIEGLGVPTR